MTSMKNAETATMNASIFVIPDEIWSNIFVNYLSLKDRKSVRMTCKWWRDSCELRRIEQKEKLNVLGVSYVHDIIDTLLTTRRSILNLKFSHIPFNGIELPLWRKCGTFIQQVELVNCSIACNSVEEILGQCPNLSYLMMKKVQTVYPNGAICHFGITFMRISENRVISSSVKTLLLDIWELLSDEELEALISTFPNVTHLEFNFHHRSHRSDDPLKGEIHVRIYRFQPNDHYDYAFHCQHFASCLAKYMPQLEHLVLEKPSDYCDCAEQVKATQFGKLKVAEFHCSGKVQFSTTHSTRIYNYAFDPKTNSNYITCMEMEIVSSLHAMSELLRTTPLLKKFKVIIRQIESERDLWMTPEHATNFRHALANSKVESLELVLSVHNLILLGMVRSQRDIHVNSSIKDLKITTSCEDQELITSYLKDFTALTRFQLVLTKGPGTNLKSIFSLPNLKCIEIKTKTDYGRIYHTDPLVSPAGNIMPTSSIQHLEYLNIDMNILRVLFHEDNYIKFDNLKCLHISQPNHLPVVNNQRMNYFMYGQPYSLNPYEVDRISKGNLEAVFFDAGINISDIGTFFLNGQDFRNLKYVGVRLDHCPDVLYQNNMKTWFYSCPCLRAILILYRQIEVIMYYDPVRKEIAEESTSILATPAIFTTPDFMDPKGHFDIGVNLFKYFRNFFHDLWKNLS